jgi:hypothetical protein
VVGALNPYLELNRLKITYHLVYEIEEQKLWPEVLYWLNGEIKREVNGFF